MDTFDFSFYKGKKVLVTGHTGFKGSWLCRLLLKLGAEVTGYALEPPTQPDLFRLLDVIRHLLRRRALHRPTVQFLQHSPRRHAPAMGNLLRFVVDYRACLAPSVPFAFLGRCPPLGHAHPHLLAVRLCLQVARPVRIPEIHPGIRFYLCGRLPRFRHLLSDGNGQTARHSLLHPPHSGLPSRLRSFFQPEKTLGVVHPTGL